MKLLKTHPLLSLLNSYLIDSPQPVNISYLWNFGSLLGVCLVIQIITGITLAMHYTPSIDAAFISVEHIMRDVNYGWLIRYLHANTASFFFLFVYAHMARGLYYGSYRSPRVLVWSIGVVIFLVMIITAFLGYVLPYGQMSLWGATVITNLMSAIPWIGQDIVESKNIVELLNCTICTTIISNRLPTIGIISEKALTKGNKRRLESQKQEYMSIPSSFLAFLVGLIDGDGYIQITRTTKGFIAIKLVISLHLSDISTLKYLESILKLGKVTEYKDLKSPSCKLIINRTDLQEVLFPLFLHHGIFFLTDTRQAQYNLAMFILNNNIKLYNEIAIFKVASLNGSRQENYDLFASVNDRQEKELSNLNQILTNPLDYVNLPFFTNWIVGFTLAEGSFFIKSNNDGCFSLKQRIHLNLFEAFKLIFDTNRKIGTEKDLYNGFSVSSKSDIQKVINFFSFSGYHPLIGSKGISYFKWLNALHKTDRYKNLKFPDVNF